jgi:ubiquinone/menaquinone biosynthesis C-methylase UbiE
MENNPPTLGWKIARLLVARSKEHAFLDHAWIGPLFALIPRRFRQGLALRLLSLSPHYWVYQWTNKYPRGMPRYKIIGAEYERNAVSRRELCEKLLRRYLRPEMTVLDFGCGPGFLAKAASAYVKCVVASDVSRGAIACARQLNHADNLKYVVNPLGNLKNIPTASIDLVYSFAVFQHLRKEQTESFFREFVRVLKPTARGVCHMILKQPGDARASDPSQGGWIRRRVNLRMVYYTPAEAADMAQRAGLHDIAITPIASLADMEDDIGKEQFLTFTN